MPKNRKPPGSKKIESRLIILCEGAKNKSEYAYLDSLIKSFDFASKKVEVKIIHVNKNTGKELVVEAASNRLTDEDKIWVAYDKDGYTKHPQTFNSAEGKNVNLAFSSISFETWILLHYEKTSRAFNKSEDVIKYLKDKNYIDYSKRSLEIFRNTKDNINTAKKNAIWLQNYHKQSSPVGSKIYDLNPYTNINELIDDIEDMKLKDK